MSDFGEHIQGMTTPYTQDSSGAQTNNQRNAVARIESCPRLPGRPDSTVATIQSINQSKHISIAPYVASESEADDSDVTLRYGIGLLHASTDRHPGGCPATGHAPVVSHAHDPCPADVDENQNRKWQENDTHSDARDGSTQTQSFPAGAVAPKGARSTNPEIFRRGWKSAGPPHPELLPDIDDSDGANAIVGAQGVGRASDLPPRHCKDIDDDYPRDRAMIVCALHVGPCVDLSLRRVENENSKAKARPWSPTVGDQVRGALNGSVPASQTAEYGYVHEKATFETPICGQRTETDDGYAP